MSDTWELVGTTETLQNNLNPEFVTSFEIPFYFERSQKAKFEVFDIDGSSKELIGSAEILLAKAMWAEHQTYTAQLEDLSKKKTGEITIKLDRVCQTGDMIYFTARAKHLPTKERIGGLLGYDRPFYYIERERAHGTGDFIKVLQIN